MCDRHGQGIDLALTEAVKARNRYINRSGYSAHQRVFGSSLRLPGSLLFLWIIVCFRASIPVRNGKTMLFLIFHWNSIKYHEKHDCSVNLHFWGFVAIRGARDTPRTINDPIGILMFAAWGHQGAAKTWKCAHFHDFLLLFTVKCRISVIPTWFHQKVVISSFRALPGAESLH